MFRNFLSFPATKGCTYICYICANATTTRVSVKYCLPRTATVQRPGQDLYAYPQRLARLAVFRSSPFRCRQTSRLRVLRSHCFPRLVENMIQLFEFVESVQFSLIRSDLRGFINSDLKSDDFRTTWGFYKARTQEPRELSPFLHGCFSDGRILVTTSNRGSNDTFHPYPQERNKRNSSIVAMSMPIQAGRYLVWR